MAEVECWTVATGNVSLLRKASRQAAKYIANLEGFVGVHIDPQGRGTVWLFNSENNAKKARNLMQGKGIKCGTNICQVFVDEKYLMEKK